MERTTPRTNLVRHYALTFDGSTVPVHVAVPFQEDGRKEEGAAIRVARAQAGRYGNRVLRSSQRGELLHMGDGDVE